MCGSIAALTVKCKKRRLARTAKARLRGTKMTVAEMINWLKTQDQDTEVHVVCHMNGTGYYDQGGTATTVAFDPNNHVDRRDAITVNGKFYEKELLLGVYEG